MPLSANVARFNRHVTNRVMGLFAGWAPGFAIVIHTGRTSGRIYRTPINAFRVGSTIRFALTYGPNTDWIHNIEAASGCDLLMGGRLLRLTNPQFGTDPTLAWLPAAARPLLRRIGATQYLSMTIADQPGGQT
ncbi:MAG TPA: hypothetical protein VF808_04355 [Ktedonobacterales bacterium]